VEIRQTPQNELNGNEAGAKQDKHPLTVKVLHGKQDVAVLFDEKMFGFRRDLSVTMGAYFTASDWKDFALWFLQQSSRYDILATAWNAGFDGDGKGLMLVHFFYSLIKTYFEQVRQRGPEGLAFYQSALCSISGWMVENQFFRKQQEMNVVSWDEVKDNFTDWLSRYCSRNEDEDDEDD